MDSDISRPPTPLSAQGRKNYDRIFKKKPAKKTAKKTMYRT